MTYGITKLYVVVRSDPTGESQMLKAFADYEPACLLATRLGRDNKLHGYEVDGVKCELLFQHC